MAPAQEIAAPEHLDSFDKEFPSLVPELTPQKLSGVLDKYDSFDLTPAIGREFTNANVVEWMDAPNSDELLRELAITISQRGVVYFRAQNDMTDERQKELIQRLGLLAGKPKTSGLYLHPLNHALGNKDSAVGSLDAKRFKTLYNRGIDGVKKDSRSGRDEWHSDNTYENIPPDYTMLRLTHLPRTGGDTMWASRYDVYDRMSATMQRFLESLKVVYEQPALVRVAETSGFDLFEGPRGAPENVGRSMRTVQPAVRTHIVTGWKSVWVGGGHFSGFEGLNKSESQMLVDYVLSVVAENPDLQVRFHWNNPNDIAIWDNRCTYHAAIHDHAGYGFRQGVRVVGIGEKPHLYPGSKSRQESLSEGQTDVRA